MRAQLFNNLRNPSLMLGFLFFAVIGIYLSHQFSISKMRENRFIPPPPMLERLDFGFAEVAADSLWVRAIQDFDYCEKPASGGKCQGNSWLFQMLDSATNLSPKFRIVYSSGALALSIIISDVEGAAALYEKGVRQFPNEWILPFRASYHAIWEEKDNVKAAHYMELAAKNGGPEWCYALSQKLYLKEGKAALGQAVLAQAIERKENPKLIELLKKRLADAEK